MSFDKANEMKNSMIKVKYVDCRKVKYPYPINLIADLLILHLLLVAEVVAHLSVVHYCLFIHTLIKLTFSSCVYTTVKTKNLKEV